MPSRSDDGGAATLNDTSDSIESAKTLEARTHVKSSAPGAVTITGVNVLGERTRYLEERLLGEGGMGTVLLCRDDRIGRRVAMKLLRSEHAGDSHSRARFVREAQVQGQLEHPAVVPVYDIGTRPDGTDYFTMKRVLGVTLEEIIDGLREGRAELVEKYTRRRLLAALASVCLAVDFAHERGVVHRDLKPGNVMLGDFGEVYVLDWGLAKIAEGDATTEPALDLADATNTAATRAGALLGTPGYMSPEQARGEHDAIGPATDVYALGAILFEILALEELHPRTSMQKLLESTLHGADARASIRAPDRAPPELDAICVQATALDPKARCASARAIEEAIERYLAGEQDQERRRELANHHASLARAAAEQASAGTSSAIDARRSAMREIGRALALDPTHGEAMRTMVRLLSEPPKHMPAEVAGEIDRAERHKTRWVGRFGAVAYASVFLYIPLLLWMGVRSPLALVVLMLPLAAAAALSAFAGLQRLPSPAIVLVVMVLSNLAFASTSAFFGPLFFAPALIAVNTTAFAAHCDRKYRAFVIAFGCASVLAPIAFEAAGLGPASYAFGVTGMTIAPHALALERTPTVVFLALTNVAIVLTSAFSVVRIRSALGEAERQLLLYAWHLRGFVPDSARGATDPTVSRRIRSRDLPPQR